MAVATIIVVAGVLSAVVGVATTIYSGMQANSAGEAQNSMAVASAERTRRLAEINATKTEAEGEAAARRIRARSRRLAGTQRAQFAARGIDLSGSATDVQYDSAIQYEVDALQEVYSANWSAWGIRTNAETQAVNTLNQGSMALAEGKNKQTSSYFSAAGSVLGGVGSAGSSIATFGMT